MKVHGEAIRAIRTAQSRSLRDVAEAAGLDAGYLMRLEKGERGATEETIRALAGGLRVNPEAISYPQQPDIPEGTDATGGVQRLMDAEQVAVILGVDRSTVHRYARAGLIGYVQVGPKRKFTAKHVETHIADNSIDARPRQRPARVSR